MVGYLIDIARKIGILPHIQSGAKMRVSETRAEAVPQFRGVYEMALDRTGKALIPYTYQATDRWIFFRSDFDDDSNGQKYICMYPRDTFTAQFPSMARKNAYPQRTKGRIYIPREWRDYSDRIDFVGIGDGIEIWDSGAWNEYSADLMPSVEGGPANKEPASRREILRIFSRAGRYHEVTTVLDKKWQERILFYVDQGIPQDEAEKGAMVNVILGRPYLEDLSSTERSVLRRFIGGENQDNIATGLGSLSETGKWESNTAATYKRDALRKLREAYSNG